MAFYIVTFDNGQTLPVNAESAEGALAHANSPEVRLGAEEVEVNGRVVKRMVIEPGAKAAEAKIADKYVIRRLAAIDETQRQLALEADTLKAQV